MSSDKPGYHTLFGRLVNFHVLHDADGVYLIDAGFVGAIPALEKYLATIERSLTDIRAILLTHGHLDHTLNVAEIQARSDCNVYAPGADRDHIAGTFPYRGASRVCGISEAIGRCLLRYQAPQVDHWFEPGDIFENLWGGLEVVALPGHTAGHSGLLSQRHHTLFAGDLFSAYGGRPKVPPHFLNTDTGQARRSIIEAATLLEQRQINQLALNHSSPESGKAQLPRLVELAKAVHDR